MDQQAFELLMDKLKNQDSEFAEFRSDVKKELAAIRKENKEILGWKDKLIGAVIVINLIATVMWKYITEKIN
jgi:hypothetical protein